MRRSGRGRGRGSGGRPCRRWRSPAAHADIDAHQFLARLCALVPPPGFHMTRYYGVLASHHRLCEHVIPTLAAPPPPPQLALDFALPSDPAASSPTSSTDHDASAGQSSSPVSSRSTSPTAENVAAACVSSRSSLTPTPSPASCTAPALCLRLLLPARSCCSPDRAPLRRRVHPLAPRCRPRCPSRAPGRTLRHARASPCTLDRAKIPRPRAPPQLTGPLRPGVRSSSRAAQGAGAGSSWQRAAGAWSSSPVVRPRVAAPSRAAPARRPGWPPARPRATPRQRHPSALSVGR